MSDFFEDFEGGTAGGSASTLNTAFDGNFGASQKFSNVHAHSGSLSITTTSIARMSWPTTGTVKDYARGEFWAYVTTPGTYTEHDLMSVSGTADPVGTDVALTAWDDAFAVFWEPSLGVYLAWEDWPYTGTTAELIPVADLGSWTDQWFKVLWELVDGEATVQVEHQTNPSLNGSASTVGLTRPNFAFFTLRCGEETGYQSWADDVSVDLVPLVVEEPEVVGGWTVS